jgi:hypothetical protein
MQSYAYMIMHNMGMSRKKRKALILQLDEEKGKRLYAENKKLYFKERFALFLKRLGLRR